jgi:myosin-5
MRKDQNCVDSNPYVEENNEKVNGLVAGSVPRGKEPEWDDNIGYFIKKVRDGKNQLICVLLIIISLD